MAASRDFAALIDQDSVILLEYQQEKAGFRLIDTRARNQHFASPEAAADAVIELLSDMKAKHASVSIVLQHFGSSAATPRAPAARCRTRSSSPELRARSSTRSRRASPGGECASKGSP
jgi:hypothetical protein